MDVRDGRYPLGPEAGRLLIKTGRTGLGSRAGHDLTIEVTRWRGEAVVDAMRPENSAVTVQADVGSFEVRGGTGGIKPLTNADRAEIKRTLQEKILNAARYPEISFTSTQVRATPSGFTIEGDLTIAGVTRPAVIQGHFEGSQARGSCVVTQSQWGIKPYSAFLGALRLRDEVQVEAEATFPSAAG